MTEFASSLSDLELYKHHFTDTDGYVDLTGSADIEDTEDSDMDTVTIYTINWTDDSGTEQETLTANANFAEQQSRQGARVTAETMKPAREGTN